MQFSLTMPILEYVYIADTISSSVSSLCRLDYSPSRYSLGVLGSQDSGVFSGINSVLAYLLRISQPTPYLLLSHRLHRKRSSDGRISYLSSLPRRKTRQSTFLTLTLANTLYKDGKDELLTTNGLLSKAMEDPREIGTNSSLWHKSEPYRVEI